MSGTGPDLWTGEDSLILPCSSASQIQARTAALRQSEQWEEVVPGISDVTVRFDPDRLSADAAQSAVEAIIANGDETPSAESIEPLELFASFAPEDAPDAEMVARHLGIAAAELPAWLCARSYVVAIMGFQPGFAYLRDTANTPPLPLARLTQPRQRVPAGSIGFLGDQACVYALDGAGGWPIVGRVDARLFDPQMNPPTLLQSGQPVRFRISA